MTLPLALRTPRLALVAATLDHILAEVAGPKALALLLSATVPSSWPPGEYDRDALEFFRSKLEETPDAVGWYGWYVMTIEDDLSRRSLVAGAGFLGPPDSAGTVELGYSVVPEARGRGYATEAVEALAVWAFDDRFVRRLIAHTHDSNAASSAVLARCGFERVGPGATSGSSQYERRRSLKA